MDTINTKQRTIGVNFSPSGQAQIVLWAPRAKNAVLYIARDDAGLPLNSEEFGYWTLQTDILRPGDSYYFLLDGDEKLGDPCSLSQPDGVHGPSEAVNLNSFYWTDDAHEPIPLKDFIVYELHIGTFTARGTFEAVTDKLDYLVDLGITAIEIMPVSQFSGERNWGYDGVFPFCAQHSYGGPAGLQQLVDACHRKGLAVILDVVYNHIGPEGNRLAEFGPYFTGKYNTPWGNAINFDDAWCDGVRQFYIENVLMWFRDFHIDALRIDAAHAIKDLSPVHILQEIRVNVDLLSQETGRRYDLIVELDLNDNRFINPISQGGFGMDAQWIDEFHHALRVSSGQERTGYYEDFDGIKALAKAYLDAYVYDGAYSVHRKKKFGSKANGNPGHQFVVFSQNHDHVGNRMLGERTSTLVSFEMQKLLAGAVMASPYIPLLFMGEEYAETNPFQYFVDHSDPELAQAVREGRKNEFAAFHLEGEAPDPLAVQTFNRSKLQWDLLKSEPHQTMFQFYKALISTRKKQPALYELDRDRIAVVYFVEKQTIILSRIHASQHIICLMNFSSCDQEAAVPAETSGWTKLLASSDKQWLGMTDLPDYIPGKFSLTLPAASFTLYTHQHE